MELENNFVSGVMLNTNQKFTFILFLASYIISESLFATIVPPGD